MEHVEQVELVAETEQSAHIAKKRRSRGLILGTGVAAIAVLGLTALPSTSSAPEVDQAEIAADENRDFEEPRVLPQASGCEDESCAPAIAGLQRMSPDLIFYEGAIYQTLPDTWVCGVMSCPAAVRAGIEDR